MTRAQASPIRRHRPTEAGIEWRREGLETQAAQRIRRQHLVALLHQLGARVAFEFLDEIDRHHGLGADLDRRLERYATLDPDILHAVGGDRFPASPVRVVGGRP